MGGVDILEVNWGEDGYCWKITWEGNGRLYGEYLIKRLEQDILDEGIWMIGLKDSYEATSDLGATLEHETRVKGQTRGQQGNLIKKLEE